MKLRSPENCGMKRWIFILGALITISTLVKGQATVGKVNLITSEAYSDWKECFELGFIQRLDTTTATMFDAETFMLSGIPAEFDFFFKFPEGHVLFKDVERKVIDGECDITLAVDTLTYQDFLTTESRKMPKSKFIMAIKNSNLTYVYIIDEFGDQTFWWNRFYPTSSAD